MPESFIAPIEACVLLSTIPTDMGEVLSSIQPGMGDPLSGVPLLPDFQLGVNGADLRIGAIGEPVDDPRLQADLAISPLRTRLEPAVAGHRAAIRLSVTPTPGAFIQPMMTWANVLAYLLDRDDAEAVWLPYQQKVTTDVMFMGTMERDPAANLIGVHAMRMDAGGASVAFTSGLAALGGTELQIRATADPAALFNALHEAVGTQINQDRLPQPGGTLNLGQQTYQLAPATGIADGRPVLDLVPSATPAEKPKKRRWPFG